MATVPKRCYLKLRLLTLRKNLKLRRVRKGLPQKVKRVHKTLKMKLMKMMKMITAMLYQFQLLISTRDLELQFQPKRSVFGIKKAHSKQKLFQKIMRLRKPLEKSSIWHSCSLPSTKKRKTL